MRRRTYTVIFFIILLSFLVSSCLRDQGMWRRIGFKHKIRGFREKITSPASNPLTSYFWMTEKKNWLAGWKYRKSHKIIGSTAEAVTDYQVRIKVHYGSGTDSGEDVYLNGKCRMDFGDIRFTTSDGQTLLDYWMEEKTNPYFASNGIAQPSNFINYPPAIYYNGKTYIAWQGGAGLDPYIIYYDHATKQWSTPVKIGTNPLSNDDHGAPALCIDANGYIHVFFGSHDSALKHARSNNPEDISAWTMLSDIGSYVSYPKPIVVGNTIYLFYRTSGGTGENPLAYVKSEDNGVTWSEQRTIITHGLNTRVYLGHIVKDGTKIHIVWCKCLVSEGAETKRENIYHVYFDTTNEHLYSMDGTDLGTSIDDTKANTYCKVFDSGEAFTNHPAMHLDTDGYPWIIFITDGISYEDTNWKFYHTRWNGSSWTNPVSITTTDNLFNFGDFIIFSPTNVDAYLTTTGLSGRGGDIEKWHWDGSTWSRVSVVLTESESGKPLNSPIVPVNFNPELKLVFCQINVGNYSDTSLELYAYSGTDFLPRVVPHAIFWVKVPSIPASHLKVETGTWTVDGYTYHRRTKITVTEKAGQSLTDYQVKVVINTKWLVDNGYATPNGNEVRFTDSDGSTLLSFWRETDFNTEETIYWVKIPSLPANSTKTIYIYYDEELTTVPDASDGDAVFDFFEDWEKGDLAGWTVDANGEGNASVTCSSESPYSGSYSARVYTDDVSLGNWTYAFLQKPDIFSYSDNYKVTFLMFLKLKDCSEKGGYRIGFEFTDGAGNKKRINYVFDLTVSGSTEWEDGLDSGDDRRIDLTPPVFDSYFKFERNVTQDFINEFGYDPYANDYFFTGLIFENREDHTGSGNRLMYVDDIGIRKYVDPEPSVEPEFEGQTTIYIYYGNPSATTTSNGENTFISFNDFDMDDWTDVGSLIYVDVANSYLYYKSDRSTSKHYSYKYVSVGTDLWAISFEIKPVAYSGSYGTFRFGFSKNAKNYIDFTTGDCAVFIQHYNGYQLFLGYAKDEPWTASSPDSYNMTANTKYYCELIRTSPTNIQLKVWADVDRTNLVHTANLTIPSDLTFNYLLASNLADGDSPTHYTEGNVDTVRVRKYVDPEPTHGVWGSEESY